MAIQRLLVANRGEIAARIFRTCDRLGVGTVAVFEAADRGSYHVRRAAQAVEISSYLSAGEHVRAAREAGADAIHPGYGFLAESPGFARAVSAAGLVWVGPPAEAIEAAGDKLEAKRLARELGVPVLADGDPDALGYPLLVKAAAGGGGRGMRRVRRREELAEAIAGAEREARAAFGDGRVFLERCLSRPRHVEVQVAADAVGHVGALGERDCSLQRRHQKLLEECPAPGLGEELRRSLHTAAVELARAVGYRSLGTVEFLVEGDAFYFLELNARIQVEHPVTEAVGGLDLVELQLEEAAGAPLEVAWTPSGHAVEARLYAEHPRTFVPQPGRIQLLELPEGIRVDPGAESGDEVPLAYDPLLAKLVAHGSTRVEALDRLADALATTRVAGVTSNLGLLRWLVVHPVVRAGEATTAFFRDHPPLSRHAAPAGPWRGGWRPAGRKPPPPAPPPDVDDVSHAASSRRDGGGAVTAPTPGTIVRVLVREGDRVAERQPLVVLEAMKMETPLPAPAEGIVARVGVREGDRVDAGVVLVELDGTSG